MKRLLVLFTLILTLSACQGRKGTELTTIPVGESEQDLIQLPEEAPEETDGHISPDGSTLVRERYDGEEGKKGKWDGYYIDVISLDGEFESYSISSALPYVECWLSDRYIVCHVGKGVIYVYDLKEAKETQLGPLYSELKVAESGVIILNPYNGYEEDHIIAYSFTDDGSINIDDPDWGGHWSEVQKVKIAP